MDRQNQEQSKSDGVFSTNFSYHVSSTDRGHIQPPSTCLFDQSTAIEIYLHKNKAVLSENVWSQEMLSEVIHEMNGKHNMARE